MRNRFKRIAALTLTLVIVFPLAIVAANWQWSRHHEREALNLKLVHSYETDPIQVDSYEQIAGLEKSEYARIKLQGTCVGEITWWRKQSLDGVPGFIGLVKYELDNSEVVLAIGWVQEPTELDLPDLSNIVARIRLIHDFNEDPSDLPKGQTNSPSTLLDSKQRIYIELVSPISKDFVPLPLPEITAGPHLGYVGQWILIAIFAVAVYIVALRNLPRD